MREELDHEWCLDHHESDPCSGTVEWLPANPPRHRSNGALAVFPRCEKHYEAYLIRTEELIEREHRYQESLYCKHGTYVGDAWGPDYLCGRCESE